MRLYIGVSQGSVREMHHFSSKRLPEGSRIYTLQMWTRKHMGLELRQQWEYCHAWWHCSLLNHTNPEAHLVLDFKSCKPLNFLHYLSWFDLNFPLHAAISHPTWHRYCVRWFKVFYLHYRDKKNEVLRSIHVVHFHRRAGEWRKWECSGFFLFSSDYESQGLPCWPGLKILTTVPGTSSGKVLPQLRQEDHRRNLDRENLIWRIV